MLIALTVYLDSYLGSSVGLFVGPFPLYFIAICLGTGAYAASMQFDGWVEKLNFMYFPLKDQVNDVPGPVMVSDTLCPAVHIWGTWNVYSGAKGIAEHYWSRAVFFHT